MLRDSRHELIVRILRAEGSTTVEALADRLGTSTATIRRDLLQLDQAGQLRRVYGGAMSIDDKDDPFVDVAAVHAEEKDKIAQTCAGLVRDGETVLLDIGTTAARVARALRGRCLTVVTSSLAVAQELQDSEDIQLILLGGMVRRDYRSLVGFLTEDNLRQIRADRLFLSTSGVRPGGHVMDTTVVEVPIKRAMIAASNQVVLIADIGKFPGTGMARVCGAADLDVLVTNGGADANTLSAFRDEGVTVIEA
ncbi:DeoR/GlpR family DNA-binding transcription regulator [Planotetraspora sp. A-T 1434]|uniref:DeoR/GlpR family DNA-binding transcription regulator n=1 Tax=Planotetraspora sp. A-T 1434 TaxID=2979219 RepID=UPI0021C167EF|nr:DeoR/GlpR family DNA-binding transcription regulator [Planotetraspora sp. A-T 1434]MCT9932280.1 DeoR/GlpR family DNA-binding transcription regulator [Planotetraspora sp. A-T 1434]